MKNYIRIIIFTLMIAAVLVLSLDLYDVKASIECITLLQKPDTDNSNTLLELDKEEVARKQQEEAKQLAQRQEADRIAEEEIRKEEARKLKLEEEAKIKKEKEEKKKEEDRKAKEEADRIAQEEAERIAKEESKKQEVAAESKPKPQEKPVVVPNTISINGLSANYLNLGKTPLSSVQSYLNAGNVTATITQFSPNDNQTTYFAGHNPGVFTFMANNLQLGSIITITDNAGNSYNYKAIDYAYTNTDGETILSSIGISAQDLYNIGSGAESICIQYCISGTMIVWYCIPV